MKKTAIKHADKSSFFYGGEPMENLFIAFPDVVSVKQMSQMLRIGTVLAYKLVKKKIIKSRKIGREYKITKVAILDYLLGGNQ